MKNGIISIIGRPNVGKSTIFNRLMGKANRALTHNEPGVTRDRHYGVMKLDEDKDNPLDVILVDTGGFYPVQVDESKDRDKFFNIMAEHAELAVNESDLVLMVVDVREGLLPFDFDILKFIRECKKPVWILINKYDSDAQAGEEADFYQLGHEPDDMFIVSGAHGLGHDRLKDRLCEFCRQNYQQSQKTGLQKGVKPRHDVVSNLAIIGAPNVGKSTLLNFLTGEKRALVSDIAGTTVDPIEAYIDLNFGKQVEHLKVKPDSFRISDDRIRQYYEELEDQKTQLQAAYHGDLDAIESKFYPENRADCDDEKGDEELEEETLKLDQRLHREIFDSEHADEIETFATDVEAAKAEEDTEKVQLDSRTFWKSVKVVDTAGIRRQKSIRGYIEEHSVYRSLRCISNADIVILMVDATQGISHQDRRLCDIALEKGKSLIICLNKIDLMRSKIKTPKERTEWIKDLRTSIPWLDFCQLLILSVKEGKGIGALKKAIVNTTLVRTRPIKAGKLNRLVFDLLAKNPVLIKGSRAKPLKVKYTAMVKADPPTFLMYSNRSKGIPRNYRRYLQNNLRKEFNLMNTPIHLIFRTNKDILSQSERK